MAGPSLFCYEGMRHQTIRGSHKDASQKPAAAFFFSLLFVLLLPIENEK
jgi:hypothetical protein